MKQWTQHDARTSQITEAGQFNSQHRASRSMMTGLDRSQYPDGCLTQAQMQATALHQCFIFSPWTTGVTGALGEQTVKRAPDSETLPEQFRAGNYNNFGSGWLTAFEASLAGFKGGNLLTEWYGNCANQAFFTETINASYGVTSPSGAVSRSIPNEHYLGLRILYNGVVIAERIGPAKAMDHFSISGAQQMPSGPLVLTLQFKPVSAGPDDPIQDVVTNDYLNQFHLFGNRVIAIGRYR